MEPFFRFMASRAGRWVRMVSGAALVALGVATAPLGLILVAIGLGPLVAGATDLCLLAPPFGYPLRGPRLRSALGQPTHVPLIAGPEPSQRTSGRPRAPPALPSARGRVAGAPTSTSAWIGVTADERDVEMVRDLLDEDYGLRDFVVRDVYGFRVRFATPLVEQGQSTSRLGVHPEQIWSFLIFPEDTMASAVLFIGWNRPHPGTDEIVLFGERAKLDELRRTDEFEAFSMKLAGMMTDFGVVPGVNWEGMQGVAKRGDPSAVVGGRRTGSR